MPVSDNAEKPCDGLSSECRSDKATLKTHKFRKWSWTPKDGRFEVTIKFSKEQSERKKNEVVKAALGEAYKCVRDLIHRQR